MALAVQKPVRVIHDLDQDFVLLGVLSLMVNFFVTRCSALPVLFLVLSILRDPSQS